MTATSLRPETSSIRQHRCSSVGYRQFERTSLERSIPDRFSDQVDLHGDCLAIGDGARRLTYGELDAWSGTIATRLAENGVRPGDRVVVLGRQGAASVASVLGALRAGATYAPLDPDEPDMRLASLVDRVEPKVIVADVGQNARARRLWPDRTTLFPGDPAAPPSPAPRVELEVGAPAYIYFTSGSTGEPKGVVDSHRNVLHNVLRYTNALRIRADDRLSLVQSPSFSGAVSSTFSALLNGAALLPMRLDHGGVARLADWMRRERVTIFHSVPSIFRAALAAGGRLPDVRIVRLEGDRAGAIDVELWRQHFEATGILANGLGTTETGLASQLIVDASFEPPEGILPVGHPLPDIEVEILDEAGRMLPPGAAGEIAVTSEFLALGYLDRDDLTAAAFQPVSGRTGVRRYSTGDLGRRRPDGCLEYLGRRDGGFKVLGLRVEPAEVEDALVRLPGVREAAARTLPGSRGEGSLVAYLVANASIDPEVLRRELAARLPPHMRPSQIMYVPSLPMGHTGKVDRAALPLPDSTAPRASIGPGADVLERHVSSIFEKVLGHPVGPHDDFFGAGGDSLDAVRVLVALEAETGVRLPASQVAIAPTPAGMASALRSRSAHPRAPRSPYPLRPGGDGPPLALVHGHDGHALIYALLARRLPRANPVWAFELDPDLDTDGDLSIESIAGRHVDALRDAKPQGPYLLGGFCYGGVVAFEMARQLAAQGEEVTLLALLGIGPEDFPRLLAPAAFERWRASLRWSQAMPEALRRIGSLTWADRWGYVVDRAGAIRRRATGTLSARDRTRRRLSVAAHAAFEEYRAEPYEGRATLILPEWSNRRYTRNPASDWAGLASETRVHEVPGSHKAMLREPVVTTVAAMLSRELDELARGIP